MEILRYLLLEYLNVDFFKRGFYFLLLLNCILFEFKLCSSVFYNVLHLQTVGSLCPNLCVFTWNTESHRTVLTPGPSWGHDSSAGLYQQRLVRPNLGTAGCSSFCVVGTILNVPGLHPPAGSNTAPSHPRWPNMSPDCWTCPGEKTAPGWEPLGSMFFENCQTHVLVSSQRGLFRFIVKLAPFSFFTYFQQNLCAHYHQKVLQPCPETRTAPLPWYSGQKGTNQEETSDKPKTRKYHPMLKGRKGLSDQTHCMTLNWPLLF